MRPITWLALMACTSLTLAADTRFRDDFQSKPGPGWRWVREKPESWRATPHGLEIRLEPGNMWGPANNARNVLVRPAPNPAEGAIETGVRIENRPTEQYEQVDLVWYYDDSHMVKIGQELVDKKLSIVMGREEKDRTRTIAIIPISAETVWVRFLVNTNRIRGQFRSGKEEAWREAGSCDLPVNGSPNISLQCYQGPAKEPRWARLSEFYLRQSKEGGTP